MKLFLAVDFTAEVADALHLRGLNLEKSIKQIKIHEQKDMHMTLQYLGDDIDPRVVVAAMQGVEIPPFTIRVSKQLNQFSHHDGAVIWNEVMDSDCGLLLLKNQIEQVLAPLLSQKENYDYIPHITLAYGANTIGLQDAIDVQYEEILVVVDKFHLFSVNDEHAGFDKIATFYLKDPTKEWVIPVMCINDFHGAIGISNGSLGAAKLATVVREYKQLYPDMVLLFGGDNYFGDPISGLLEGAPVSDMMRALQVEASVLGNHDFDSGIQAIKKWQKEGEFQFLAVNLIDKVTQQIPEFVQPYYMIEKRGVKVAILGVVLEESLVTADRPKEMERYIITDAVASSQYWVDFLKDGGDSKGVPDVILALTHFALKISSISGLEGKEVKDLLHRVSGFDGVFTAHWHQFIQCEIDGIPVVQGGSMGRGFAALHIVLDETNQVKRVEGRFRDLMGMADKIKEDVGMNQQLEQHITVAKQTLDQVMFQADGDIVHRDVITNAIDIKGTPLTRISTQMMATICGCDIALLYAGRLGGGFTKGPVTLGQYYKTMMFSNVLVSTQLLGRDLIKNIQIGMRTLSIDGASPLAVYGLNIAVDMTRPQGQRALSIQLSNGEAIDPNCYYNIAIEDYLADNPLGFDFSQDRNRTYLNRDLREVLLETLMDRGHLDDAQPFNITE